MKNGLCGHRNNIKWLVALFSIVISISACGKSSMEIVEAEPITLQMPEGKGVFIEKLDDLYVVYYNQSYEFDLFLEQGVSNDEELVQFFSDNGLKPYDDLLNMMNRPFSAFCSAYSAYNLDGEPILGRNLESGSDGVPVMVITAPEDGYKSVSMVNGIYFGMNNDYETTNPDVMLCMPYAPFDGMNEWGLTVASNSVSASCEIDPAKTTISSYGAMRAMLDYAKSIDEALEILDTYNIYFQAGATIKYIIADATGASVQIEYAGDEKVIVKKEGTFQAATNFRASAFVDAVEPATKKACKRYATLYETLKDCEGSISDDVNDQKALKLLKDVGQPFLTWSSVYNQSSGEITVATKTNHKYNTTHLFVLPMKN